MSSARLQDFTRHYRDRTPIGRPVAIPSWIVSVALHGTLLIVLATTMKSCGSGVPGAAEGQFREVGIYIDAPEQQPNEQQPPAEPTPQTEPPSALATSADPIVDTARQVQDTASDVQDLLDIPDTQEPLLGIGGALPTGTADTTSPLAVADSVRGGSAGAGQPFPVGQGQTPFFGIRDSGTRFVYVVDKSGSMSKHGAMRMAKAELLASLKTLDATQQFQIIFYSNHPVVMSTPRGGSELLWATDINKTLAQQFVAGVQPDGGTDHMPALIRALKLNPDVVFFLTDAEEPRLSSGQLDRIRRLNGSRARIHCIEFGTGPKLGNVENFLQKLARENGGSYRYHDITRFARR
ncbi:MAG: VWA domain-containing protein [Planctomycetota bacterium]|nr:MAG: VWA domain-containing protein [Planctomycetota bacterium]